MKVLSLFDGISRGQWNWENRMKYEDACVKFLMNKEKGKTK